MTVGSQTILASLQILNGNTAETIFADNCKTRITHSRILYVLFLPTMLRIYRINDERASPVLMVTRGISMAMYFRTSETCWKGIWARLLPKPWFADLARKTVAATVAPLILLVWDSVVQRYPGEDIPML